MRGHTGVLIALALVAGCGDNKDSGSPAPGRESTDQPTRPAKQSANPTGTPRPQSKLTVTVDGKPVAMATALAWKNWDGTVKITASSVAVGCDEVTGTMRRRHDGEVTFDVAIGQLLQPDGTLKPQIRQTYYDGMTSQLTAGPVAGSGGGAAGEPTTVEVDFKTEGVGRDKHALVVKGTIDALGCATPPPKDAPLPPEMPATIEIAGKKLPIRGARISKVGDWPQLLLTTGGEGCKQVAFQRDGDLAVELTWIKKGEAAVSQISLRGVLLPNASDQTFDKTKLTVTPSPPLAGEIELAGDIVVSKYPVKLAGKVTAVECPK